MVEQEAFCYNKNAMTDTDKDGGYGKGIEEEGNEACRKSEETHFDRVFLPRLDHTRSREVVGHPHHDKDRVMVTEAFSIPKMSLDTISPEKSEYRHYIFLKPCVHMDADQPVLFFDLDNTLYSRDLGIAEEMGERIQLYFQQHLALPAEESRQLGQQYYLDYGLAIKGLLHNFHIDPATYDAFVDGGLQLENKLRPDTRLINLLEKTDARRWVFTNAGIQHATRVLRLLGLEELFEGIVYCNYDEPDFPAKPDRAAFERAMRAADVVGRPDLCWFVDDNMTNVQVSRSLGWHAIHLDERQTELDWLRQEREQGADNRATHVQQEQLGKDYVTNLYDLEIAFSSIFPKQSQ